MYANQVNDYRLHSYQLNAEALADDQGFMLTLTAQVARFEDTRVTISATVVIQPMATKLTASDLLMIETELRRSWDGQIAPGTVGKVHTIAGLMEAVIVPLTFEDLFEKMRDATGLTD